MLVNSELILGFVSLIIGMIGGVLMFSTHVAFSIVMFAGFFMSAVWFAISQQPYPSETKRRTPI